MDLNILISTIVTATAALVAIIGGFLVSRVITMASERKGIERRIRELANDLSTKQNMYEKAERILLDDDAEDFIVKNMEDLILKEKTLDEIINSDTNNYRSVKELNPYLEEFEQIVEEVMEMVSGYYREDVENSFETFANDKEIKVRFPEKSYLYEESYYFIKKSLPKRPAPRFAPGIAFQHNSFTMKPSLLSSVGPVSHQVYRDRKKNRDILDDEVKILTLQLEEQEKILNDYAKPKGFWGGLLVLFYASIVGVIFPTTLLPYPTEYYDDLRTKWLLISLFISQLLSLFIYLTYEIYKMTIFNKNKYY